MGTITALVAPERDTELLREYSADDLERDIDKMRGECAGLDPSAGPEAYEASRVAVGKLRTSRTAIEKCRTSLKAGLLDRGRRIDAVAKWLTAKIEEIEAPLKAKKDAVDQAAARAKFLAEDAERVARETKEREAREAEDKKRRDDIAAQEAELAERRRLQGIEDDRIAFEQAALEVSRRAEEKRAAAERKKFDDERKAFEAEKAAAKAKADAAEAAARAEKDAAEKAERDQAEQKAALERRAAALKEEMAREEAQRPDRAKLMRMAGEIRLFARDHAPDITTPAAGEVLDKALVALEDVARALEAFGS